MSSTKETIKGIIAGGILGSSISLLFAPKKGSELRKDIRHKFSFGFNAASEIAAKYKKQAQQFGDDLVVKAENILKLTKSFAEGKYNGTVDIFESELANLKRAFHAATESYKHYGEHRPETNSIVEEIFSEYENEKLPKTEGMKRRTDAKIK